MYLQIINQTCKCHANYYFIGVTIRFDFCFCSLYSTNQAQISNLANHVENHVLGGNVHENSTQPPKMVPRNNEYLERQSKISDIRGGPSPAQASDAPESNQLQTPFRQNQLSNMPASFKPPIVTLQTVNNNQQTTAGDRMQSNNKLPPVNAEPIIRRVTVTAHKLRDADISEMKSSIKDFKFHFADRAVKLGVVRNSGDMFAKMKADGNLAIMRVNRYNEFEK